MIECHIARSLRVVEAPVRIFFYDDRPARVFAFFRHVVPLFEALLRLFAGAAVTLAHHQRIMPVQRLLHGRHNFRYPVGRATHWFSAGISPISPLLAFAADAARAGHPA